MVKPTSGVIRLKLDLNFFSLLPQDHPAFRTLLELTETIGFQSLLIIHNKCAILDGRLF